MKWNGNGAFALILIGCGALILLNKMGLHLGGILGFIIPAVMVVLGYIGFRGGRKLLGAIFMVIGAIILLGKLSWIIGLIVAIGMIYYGITILKKRDSTM